jgi:transcriptional regulator with XRE-family HTH domain
MGVAVNLCSSVQRCYVFGRVAGVIGSARKTHHRKALADQVRRQRVRVNWTQDDLADRLGVDRRQVDRLEQGKASTGLEVIEALAEAFGITSLAFVYSTVSPELNLSAPSALDASALAQFSRAEIAERYQLSLSRPGLAELVEDASALPDQKLNAAKQFCAALRHTDTCPESPPSAPATVVWASEYRAAMRARRPEPTSRRGGGNPDDKAR